MGSQGIRIALDEGGVDQVAVLQRVHRPQLRQTVRRCIKEQLLRLCGGLHHQRLVRKVGQGIDVAAGAHGHHLTAVQIGPGPGVFVLTPVHGKAAPGTVNGAVLHQGLLLLPVDGHELHPITQAAECLLGQLHIHAGGLTVRAGVIERRVVVAAHHDDRQLCRAAVRFFFGRAAATQQHHAQAQHRQRQAEKPQSSASCIHNPLPLIPSVIGRTFGNNRKIDGHIIANAPAR